MPLNARMVLFVIEQEKCSPVVFVMIVEFSVAAGVGRKVSVVTRNKY